MKHLRMTARPDPDRAPRFFDLLAASPHASEARLVDWNLGPEEAATLLYWIEGDPDAFRASATETPGIDSVDVSAANTGRADVPETDAGFHMLVRARPTAIPLVRRMVGAVARAGLVVVTPVVYRDRQVDADFVGDPAALQATLDEAPADVDLTVREIGSFEGAGRRPAARLSERQRAAVATALELGYYEVPREVTTDDVAAELGCSASTASYHLRTAEAKLIRACMRRERPAETA